jgi:DNA helicase II / ATP-dependent DNA helicase PcrA
VSVLNTVDGCIPSDFGVASTSELEQELHLLFVAGTREGPAAPVVPSASIPMDSAVLGDRHGYAQRSPFISNSGLLLFRSHQSPQPKTAMSALRPAGKFLDAKARTQGMWANTPAPGACNVSIMENLSGRSDS